MKSPEIHTAPQPLVERYQLPDDGWSSIDEVPADFRQIVELQMMARDDAASNDQVARHSVDLDEVYAVYDDWVGGQNIFVVRNDDGGIDGMLSYYLESDGTPFFESVAVDPDTQGGGIGRALIDHALEDVAQHSPQAEFVITRAQNRVVELYESRWGAQPLDDTSQAGVVRMAIPIPRS